jgi:hypothetical protein
MVELYLHSPIRLHGMEINKLSTGASHLPYDILISVKTTIPWGGVTLYNPVKFTHISKEYSAWLDISSLKMESAHFSENESEFYRSTRPRVIKSRTLHFANFLTGYVS